jgi:hypothetical protein
LVTGKGSGYSKNREESNVAGKLLSERENRVSNTGEAAGNESSKPLENKKEGGIFILHIVQREAIRRY